MQAGSGHAAAGRFALERAPAAGHGIGILIAVMPFDMQQRAKRARIRQAFKLAHRRPPAAVLADGKNDARAATHIHHLIGVAARKRERLLAKDVLSGGRGSDYLRQMERMRRGEYDGGNRRIRGGILVGREQPQAVLGAGVTGRGRIGFGTGGEAQLARVPLPRLDEAASPAAKADDGGADHSGCIPASRISRVHLTISCLMKAANSAGGSGAGSRPSPASFDLTSGLARLAVTTSGTLASIAFAGFDG